MTSLSRSTSHNNTTTTNTKGSSTSDDGQKSPAEPNNLTAVNGEASDLTSQPASFDPSSETNVPSIKSRTNSKSLLSSLSASSSTNRKGRFADAGISDGSVARASMSMPPPASKVSAARNTSNSGRPPSFPAGGENMRPGANELEGTQEIEPGSVIPDDVEKTPNPGGTTNSCGSSYSSLTLPESALRPPVSANTASTDGESNRLSFSSLYSAGSVVPGSTAGASGAQSKASSTNGSVRSGLPDQLGPATGILSPSLGSSRADASSAATTATDPISVTISANSHQAGTTTSPSVNSPHSNTTIAAKHLESWSTGPATRPTNQSRRSRSRTQRRPSASTAASSASPNNSERGTLAKSASLGKIGVCALDVKARSKPSRNILTRLQNNGEFDVVLFGDKVILDEDVENWPLCDYLISFFSDGFPLDKAIAYAHFRKPYCVNDLPMQKVLWDRRICLRILDSLGVPTPKRVEVNRDGGPTLESADLAHHVFHMSGVKLEGPENGTGGGIPAPKKVELFDNEDTLIVDGVSLRKPFVEKPISGEDHNVRIYFPSSEGGGGRKLFRKIGNKSSEWDENMTIPRAITEKGSSYIYEQFLNVDNAEDIKAYTVGTDFCHAETRKSPVVDGLVRRNTHGKEIRYITSLTKEEQAMASKIAQGFGQRICGFDLLRVGSKSYVIDVNGWSFVKDNNEYYDRCSGILKTLFDQERRKCDGHRSSKERSAENLADAVPPSRQSTSQHRSGLKGLFKSPSFSKFGGMNLDQRTQGAASPDLKPTTSPLTSPPSVERQGTRAMPASHEILPSPALPDVNTDALGIRNSTLTDQSQSPMDPPMPASKHSWKLKGMVAVIRHADRTPKQKFKFTFHTQPFINLLRGHQEEVLLKGEAALASVSNAVKVAMHEGIENPEKLHLLRTSLARKGAWTGTKVQIKPMFRRRKPEEIDGHSSGEANMDSEHAVRTPDASSLEEPMNIIQTPVRSDSLAGITLSRFSAAENDLVLDKLQLIIKWGGEPTHSARYQAQDLGENMRNDLILMNKEALGDVRIFTSSERRVSTSAQIWATSFLKQKDISEDFISVRKDLLDDSNAAKDVMDKVKKKLKHLLREGNQAPPQFAWPSNTPEPSIVVQKVTELMNFHRRVMRYNFTKLGNSAAASLSALNLNKDESSSSSSTGNRSLAQAQALSSIQARWCCGEDAELFRERWEKLFTEFVDSEKVDPGKISELYDTMKFDALHNRQFLEWVFTPSSSMLEEDASVERKSASEVDSEEAVPSLENSGRKDSNAVDKPTEKPTGNNLAQRMGFRRRSVMNPALPSPLAQETDQESYFKLFNGSAQSRAKQDVRLAKLRELYKLAKILFDFVGPQEYGIEDSEKLEIGLLTSLPLLKEIVKDLEEVQASDDAKSFIYFTKESHIYTMLNCILEGGIKTKIARNTIPELDYLSQIVFELYEAEDKDADSFAYSIRITISPGCHTFDPLDVQLDSKHSIGCTPRRSLTAHGDWKEVIETLRAKFDTVKLPKSFLAVNLSDLHTRGGSEDVEGFGEERKEGKL